MAQTVVLITLTLPPLGPNWLWIMWTVQDLVVYKVLSEWEQPEDEAKPLRNKCIPNFDEQETSQAFLQYKSILFSILGIWCQTYGNHIKKRCFKGTEREIRVLFTVRMICLIQLKVRVSTYFAVNYHIMTESVCVCVYAEIKSKQPLRLCVSLPQKNSSAPAGSRDPRLEISLRLLLCVCHSVCCLFTEHPPTPTPSSSLTPLPQTSASPPTHDTDNTLGSDNDHLLNDRAIFLSPSLSPPLSSLSLSLCCWVTSELRLVNKSQTDSTAECL